MQILRGFTPEEQPILEDNEKPITLKYVLCHDLTCPYARVY
jgi:hypothetical protein